jgi:predicted NUDIX family NTP pyrophosphohydrolase
VAKQSAGILVYRRSGDEWQVFLVHPGGPFWAKKDLGAWSMPKGEFPEEEDALLAAKREFREEVGQGIEGTFVALEPRRQKSGKTIHAWAIEGDCDPTAARSNTFSMEWPPRSGRQREFTEIDRAAWFGLEEAGERIGKGQRPLIDQLRTLLEGESDRNVLG